VRELHGVHQRLHHCDAPPAASIRDPDRCTTTAAPNARPRGRADRLGRPDGERLNWERLNCADLQIATSLALVDYRLDVRENLRGRPAAKLMDRVLPERSAY
jgi:hypothetical protein